MYPLTEQQLRAMLGGAANDSRPGLWLAPLNEAMLACAIIGPVRQAAFLAQVLLESAELCRLEETLSYSPQRLRQEWPQHFPSDTMGVPFSHAPERLANLVYAGRFGNGDVASGDGWRYRGRGLLRLTGRDNYAALAQALPIDALANPDLLRLPRGAALSAAWLWQASGLNELAELIASTDADADFDELARRVNGSSHSQLKRRACLARAQLALAGPSSRFA